MNEYYTIDTPENIEFSYSIAGIASRFLAAIIDTMLLMLLQAVLAIVMLVLMSQGDALFVDDLGSGVTSIIGAVWGVLGFAFFWGYYIVFELLWNGQTPGKRVIRLRVVRDGGRPITFVASAIRNLIRIIDFLPSFYGLGVMVMFIDKHARRLGDLAGGTLVVKDRLAVSLDSLTRQAEQHVALPRGVAAPGQAQAGADGAGFTPTLPNLHLLGDADYDLVQEFLRRRDELGKDSRARLGVQLAEGVGVRLGLGLSQGYHEAFLEQVAYEYRLAREAEG